MIAYAYPTSINAEKLGFGETGCFAVELAVDCNPPTAYMGFITLPEARAAADELKYEYSRHTY